MSYVPRSFVLFVIMLASHSHSSIAAGAEASVRDLLSTSPDTDDVAVLPDFSYAGYQRGERPIPRRATQVSVTQFGAKADDDGDDTAAFQNAIKASPGKVIAVPAGRYVLSDRLVIDTSGTVLRGAGEGRTTLHFTRPLEQIEPNAGRTGHGTPTTNWSWSGGLILIGREGKPAEGAAIPFEPTDRGSRVLQLPGPGLGLGDELYIEARNDESNALAKHLYAGDVGPRDTDLKSIHAAQVARVVRIDGDAVTLDRPLRFDIRPAWATLKRFEPAVTQSGVEGLTIDFPSVPYRGHFQEDGYNGVAFGRNTAHCWLRDVTIVNGDSGVYVNGHFNTIEGLILKADRKPDKNGDTGHHAIHVGGTDNLVTKFDLQTRMIHDLGLGSGSVGNVYSIGRGKNLTLDHHRWAPYRNLYSDLDAGAGTRLFHSGGTQTRGRHAATGAVFWNIRSEQPAKMPDDDFAPPVGVFFIGVNGLKQGEGRKGWIVLPLDVAESEPANLHEWQRRR